MHLYHIWIESVLQLGRSCLHLPIMIYIEWKYLEQDLIECDSQTPTISNLEMVVNSLVKTSRVDLRCLVDSRSTTLESYKSLTLAESKIYKSWNEVVTNKYVVRFDVTMCNSIPVTESNSSCYHVQLKFENIERYITVSQPTHHAQRLVILNNVRRIN